MEHRSTGTLKQWSVSDYSCDSFPPNVVGVPRCHIGKDVIELHEYVYKEPTILPLENMPKETYSYG